MKKAIHFLACSVVIGLLAACKTTCKIEPPPTGVQADKAMGAKVAAEALSSAISKGSIEGNYRNMVNTTYVTVGQDDVALYLLLQAANCESAQGHAAQADQLLQMARQQLARRQKSSPEAVAENPTNLTPTENKVLKKSPLKEEIAKNLKTPGRAAKGTRTTKHKTEAKPSPTPSE
jgi:hypothetical protein